MKILVVDNDDTSCEYLVQTLGELGADASWTNNGSDAVKMLSQVHSSDHAFDMVLLDWKMPGMDGVETARMIRENINDKLPILIASAYDWADVEKEAMQVGIDGFLQKPLFKSTLYDGIQRYILKQQNESMEERPYSLRGKRILLVEDNYLNCEIAVELLNILEIAVEHVKDGAEAVAQFGQSPPNYYDLILMDVQMPNMNGYEATRKIRAMSREDAGSVPIVAMTADAFAEDVEAARNAGMNSHLAKPFDMESLSRELRKYI